MDLVVPEVCSQCTQTCPWNGRRCWCDTGFAWLPDGCSHRLHHNEEKRNSSQNIFTTGTTGAGEINSRISGDLETSIMQDELYGGVSWVFGPKNWTRLHVPTKHCQIMFFDFSSSFNTVQSLQLAQKFSVMQVDQHLIAGNTGLTDSLLVWCGDEQHGHTQENCTVTLPVYPLHLWFGFNSRTFLQQKF